ncbi:hypothetical protein AMR72_08615 [Flavobacterium psychrophilum]|nr:hypothetical protein AMR72_08615 [Flavobacterium psychrophilum]AOE52561.1 hypothetical protein ALW18_08605 [Flavobacterium psychrophilum]
MREWKNVELGSIIDTLKGNAFKSSNYVDIGVPIVRVSDFTDNSISSESLKYIDSEYAKLYKKHELLHWDIIIQTVGSWQHNPASIVGKVVRVPKELQYALLNQNAVKIIPKEIHPRFLYYRLKNDDFKFYLLGRAQGAANQASITLNTIRNFNFLIPELTEQGKIASILSSYDDLIDNNLQRVKLLDESVRTIYHEWFVKFKIFEQHLEINENTGLPKFWEKISCADAVEVFSGGTPKTTISDYWHDEIQFFTPKDASPYAYTNGTEKKISKLGLQKCNSKLYPTNTIFVTARGTVGKLNMALEPMAMNQSCYALQGKHGISQVFLYCSLLDTIDHIKSAANGGVFDTIVVDTFKYLSFIRPSEDIIDLFTAHVEPMFEMIRYLIIQNQKLREARDILLPRLMSGEINVEDVPEEKLERVVKEEVCN